MSSEGPAASQATSAEANAQKQEESNSGGFERIRQSLLDLDTTKFFGGYASQETPATQAKSEETTAQKQEEDGNNSDFVPLWGGGAVDNDQGSKSQSQEADSGTGSDGKDKEAPGMQRGSLTWSEVWPFQAVNVFQSSKSPKD